MKTRFLISTLANGMRVISVPEVGEETTSVFVFCKVGSRFETRAINGSSHFVEHLMFKGTKKRPSTLVLSQELESMGAEFNAFTSKDYTGYYIKAAKRHVRPMVEMLYDMLFHSVYDPKEINRERTVIIEEIKMYHENPMMHIEDLTEQVAFPRTPLGWSIAGPAKTIARVPRSALLKHRDTFYRPSNMICVVAGSVPANIRSMVHEYFGLERAPFRRTRARPGKMVSRQFFGEKRNTQQMQLGITFPGFPHLHKDIPILEVISTLLGGSMSSRLFISVRERLGLCYYIKSDVVPYEDTGLLSVYAGISASRIKEAVSAIGRVIGTFSQNPVTPKELARAKEYIKGKTILQLETSDKMAQWFGQEALFMKTPQTPEKRIREIERVTARDIQRVAKHVLRTEKASAAGIGPLTKSQFKALFRDWR